MITRCKAAGAWCCLAGAVLTARGGEASSAVVLHLGERVICTDQFTRGGVPVVPMWRATGPAHAAPGAELPVLPLAEHSPVWRPASRTEGAYNHYSALIWAGDRFYALWANHPLGEDAPGQRVLFASSRDGREWSLPRELFPAPGPVLAAGQPGLCLKPDRWIVASNTLYAVVYVHGAGVYPLARSVHLDGSLGEPFVLRALPANARLPAFMSTPLLRPVEAQAITEAYGQSDTVSWWAHVAGEGVPSQAIDGARLMEPFCWRGRNGLVLCLRSNQTAKSVPVQNNRLYLSFRDRYGQWSVPYPSDIPDAPSRAQATTLPDGRVLLVGNQIARHFDRGLHLRRDPLTLATSADGEVFDHVFALRARAPSRHRFPGVTGRGQGFGYPSMVVHEGALYVLYSVNKEEIAISRVPLSGLDSSSPRGENQELLNDFRNGRLPQDGGMGTMEPSAP